jgi:hypothetical protein
MKHWEHGRTAKIHEGKTVDISSSNPNQVVQPPDEGDTCGDTSNEVTLEVSPVTLEVSPKTEVSPKVSSPKWPKKPMF